MKTRCSVLQIIVSCIAFLMKLLGFQYIPEFYFSCYHLLTILTHYPIIDTHASNKGIDVRATQSTGMAPKVCFSFFLKCAFSGHYIPPNIFASFLPILIISLYDLLQNLHL